MESSTEELDPVIVELVRRCSVDWGEAPHYTKEYRDIRWPGVKFKNEEGSPREIYDKRPVWLQSIIADKKTKNRGAWDKDRIWGSLVGDIKFCMRENIPIKTNSFEYQPSTQWLLLKGKRFLKYDIHSGFLTHFSLGGRYDKLTSYMLRKFSIRVKLHGKTVMWDQAFRLGRVMPEQWVPIDIYTEYELSVLYEARTYEFLIRRDRQPIRNRPGAAPRARRVQETAAVPPTLIDVTQFMNTR
jgi:hypothetical protein